MERFRLGRDDGKRFRALSGSARKRDGWRRQRQEVASSADRLEVTVLDGVVELGIPLGADQGKLSCWLWLRYRETDPLAVSVSVCAPSSAVVLERAVLRSDLRTALERSVSYAGLGIGPGVTRGVTMFYMREDGVTMTILVPSDALARFLRATFGLVPDDIAETAALSRAFDAVVHPQKS